MRTLPRFTSCIITSFAFIESFACRLLWPLASLLALGKGLTLLRRLNPMKQSQMGDANGMENVRAIYAYLKNYQTTPSQKLPLEMQVP